MKKFLLLSISLLISANTSAATFLMENYISPADFVDVHYQICKGVYPCTEPVVVARLEPEMTFKIQISVPEGQLATVTVLSGTYKGTITEFEKCKTSFRNSQQGAVFIKKEDVLTCRPASFTSHQMRKK